MIAIAIICGGDRARITIDIRNINIVIIKIITYVFIATVLKFIIIIIINLTKFCTTFS